MPGRRSSCWAFIALVCTVALAARRPGGAGREDPHDRERAAQALRRRRDRPDDVPGATWRSAPTSAQRIKRLTGARRTQLAGALATVEGMAARGMLRAARLTRSSSRSSATRSGGPPRPLLGCGARVSFEGSELVWQYVPGQGLQLHPLANFGKLNALAKGSKRNDARTSLLLDELLADRRAARRRDRVGVLLQLRRRPAAVGERPRAGDRPAGDRPRGGQARPPARAAPARSSGSHAVRAAAADRRPRRGRRRERTTRSTRSRPGCGSSTASSSRSSGSTTSPT